MGEIAGLLNTVITVVEVIVFIRIILSWVPGASNRNEFVRLVYSITEPLLAPFRMIVPLGRMGGIDVSPIILFLVLGLLKQLIGMLF